MGTYENHTERLPSLGAAIAGGPRIRLRGRLRRTVLPNGDDGGVSEIDRANEMTERLRGAWPAASVMSREEDGDPSSSASRQGVAGGPREGAAGRSDVAGGRAGSPQESPPATRLSRESLGSEPPAAPEEEAVELLLVDDEDDFRESAAHYFRRRGHRVTAVASGRDALEAMRQRQFDVAVVDVHMPQMDGVALLKNMRAEGEHLQVLMLTGGATVSTAVASLKAGAIDYVTKPIRLADLEALIRKAARTADLERENARLREVIHRSHPASNIVGRSAQIREVLRLIERVAASDKPVLIEGESGTGKELVARAIHAAGPLADRPLVVINCAALPEQLLESELFGHEKGAFTGAVSSKPGLFEMADGGTLFIDEIGELAGSLQAKLLRVLEDGVIRRVGGVKERRTKVRVLAATNRDLSLEVQENRFREDLYYRINVLKILLPPLRERSGDVELLVDHLLGPGWRLEPGVIERLRGYRWPGNVRQLANALERAKLLADEDRVIRAANLPPEIQRDAAAAPDASPNDDSALAPRSPTATPQDLASLNKRHVEETLRRLGGNKSQAARELGINRRSLYRLIEKYGLDE
jgi:DNA-binding NtrC family response regulator